MLGQVEKPLFGFLDLRRGRLVDARVERRVHHVLADLDELSAEREVVDGAAVIAGVDDGHGGAGEPRQVLRPAHVPKRLVVVEVMLERDRGGDLSALDQLGGRLIDAAVDALEEVLRREKRRNPVDRIVVDEDGAQQRLLGLDVVRERPVLRRAAFLPLDRAHGLHGRTLARRPRLGIARAAPPPTNLWMECAHTL